VVSLSTLDVDSGIGLLRALGVRGDEPWLAEAARACGLHAKAVELLGTYLVHYRAGEAEHYHDLPALALEGASAEDNHVSRVLEAHPLVRRGFETVLGAGHAARSRAGFLRGRPDRRPPVSLEDAREEVELFHAYADAGLWNEADSTFVALDNPKHRFLAPAFERDLLLRFFPHNDWRQLPLWPGFGRYRSLAICFELLGQFEDAIETYRPAD